MHFNQLLKERYSVRAFKPQKVSKALIAQVIEAGRMAPSAANKQPWIFVVVSDEPEISKIKSAYPRDWFAEAPQILVICGNHDVAWKRSHDNKDHCDIDVAIATDHMTLRATELGLGTCWVCNFDPVLIRQAIDLPEHFEPIVLLPIGYPMQLEVPLKTRKSPSEVVYDGKFGNPF